MPPSVHSLVHRLLEEQASRTPENGALEFYPNVRFNYHELNEISNRLARYLKHHRSMSREIVALCLEKTHVLVIAILAVLKAGMAWLPLPLDAPPARIEQLLRSCDLEFVLCSESSSHIVGPLARYIKLDEILKSPELQFYSSNNLDDCGRSATDLCHILFTSGSTGIPKGVMIEHRAVVHNVWALVKQFNLDCQTRTFQFAAPTFDVFGLDLFMTFASGGCIVMAPLSNIVDNITAFMRKTKITYTQLTPTIIQLINPTGVPSLQVLASSGEPLSQNLASQWRNKVRLINAYGPTETIVCATQELSGNQIDAVCIGRAVAGLEVCLFPDKCVDEVPEGEVGEICVAGPQLFRGYISTQTDLTSVEWRRNRRRYYRTGDFGRVETCATGEKTIRYLGRRDGQVKVHGIRIDLGDIEQSILTCPGIKQCAVVLPQRGSSAGHLCSIIVPQSSFAAEDPSIDESLKIQEAHLAKLLSQLLPVQVLHASSQVLLALREAKSTVMTRLPTHAIPTTWLATKELPLTSSNKIDRRKLQAWLEDMDRQTYVCLLESFADEPPQPAHSKDVHMQLLQSLWAEVLDRPVSSISIAASFVELGADSLDVIRFISKARKANLHLNYSQVFTARTIQGLAHCQRPLEQSHKSPEALSYIPFSLLPRTRLLAPILEEAATACGVRVAEIEDIYPCTPYQAGLMTLDLKCPMSYVCAFSWTLPQNIKMDQFRFAWDSIISTEPVLRNRLIWDASSQDFWQVTVQHKSARWFEEDFEGPMSLGNDLCRGFVRWDAEAQRWKFLLKIHHSIIDGWSLRLVLNRLKSIYNSGIIQDHSGFPYAHFIRHRLEQGRCKEIACEKFWNKYLEDTSAQDFPPLPSDPNHEVHATDLQSLKALFNSQEMATRYGVTPATILYAAAALVLGAHGENDDVIFGLILAGRDAPLDGIFDMVGPAFVSFPFRTPIDRRLALGKFLQIVERQVLDIIPHQDYGLQRIKQCGTGAAAACQFRCLVVVQPEDENLAGEGLWEKVHGQTSGLADSVPLALELVLGENQVLINCNADPAYLSQEHVGYILTHFDCVLRGLSASGPDDHVSQINLAEKEGMARMHAWAQAYGAPINCCLHELIQDSVQRYPEQIAIEDQATQRQFTYRELDAVTGRLSTFLRFQCGIAPEVIIPIALEKSALAIITILAVLRAGGAYVPIDLGWSLEHVRHILEETRATTILCSSAVAGQYRDLSQKVLEITETCWNDDNAVTNSPLNNMTSAAPSNLAYVMYTSGSDGELKGVMLEHRALSTSLTHLAERFALSPGTRHLQFSSFGYDVSVADIFIPLLSGACICVPTEHNRLNRLSLTMSDMAIESAMLTPSMIDLISPADASTLKTLITSGEMARSSLIRRWAPRVQMFNAYGPTEASILSTVTDSLSTNADPSKIGWNVTGWHWIVHRDRTGEIRLAPMGCVGEIAIAGHILARGYLNNDTLSQQHFVEAPQLTDDLIPSCIFLTGDLGRYEVDGKIRILGRKDQMIKVNGVRVEPGESQNQLQQLGGKFASCVVQCVYDEQVNVKLAAFIEVGPAAPGKSLDQRHIAVRECTPAFLEMCQMAHRRLEKKISRKYIPTLFVPITNMPYTIGHKVDLKRLREELQQIPNTSSVFGINGEVGVQSLGKIPVTPSEIALEAAFCQVFAQKRRITTIEDFFHQGGDSFTAIKLVSAARDRGFEISIRQIYSHPRLGDLAAAATPVYKTTAGSTQDKSMSSPSLKASEHLRTEIAERCNIPLDKIEDIYPASTFQEGLAAIAWEDHGRVSKQQKSAYNAKMTFRLARGVNLARLKWALAVVVSQNPIFRTRLVDSSEGIMQVVHRDLPSYEMDEKKGEKYFRYWIQQDERQDKACLVLSIHHILYDAWTLNRLLEDVNHNYAHPNNARQGARPYRYFINYLSTLDSEEGGKYWVKQLSGTPLTPFPQLPHTSYRARATESIEYQSIMNLEDTKAVGISAATVVVVAMGLLLSAYWGMDDVCYGMSLSGRDEPGFEDIAGPTLSTVPMRLQVRRDQTVARLLAEAQESLLTMRQYQHYGLQSIAQLPNEGAQNACKFRTLLAIQHSFKSPVGDRDDRVVQSLVPEETSMYVDYPLVVIAEIDASTGRFELRVEYDPTCLQTVQARRFIRQLEQVLTQCTCPDKPASEVEFITTADRAEIEAWNPPPPPASPQYLHHLFEEIVSQQPKRPAMESTLLENNGLYRHITYHQLNEYATKVCDRIKACASSFPLLFGVCFDKSPLMVIVMLAIWKAGGAFAPLDPSAPVSRLLTILADMGPDTLIITEPSHAHLFGPSQITNLDTLFPTLMLVAPTDPTSEQKTSARPQPSGASDMAYIIYTSGSSGTPKGVVIGQSAIATSLLKAAPILRMGPKTRMLQYAAFTFDASTVEIFGTLITGGCLCMPTESQRLVGGLTDVVRQLRVNMLALTPTVAQLLEPDEIPAVEDLVLVGEAPPGKLIAKWATKRPAVQVVNAYGPTEASAISALNTAMRSDDPHNIGQATACNLFITVTDDVNKLAAIGAIGELVICGNTLADGYLNKLGLTTEVFGTNLVWMSRPEGEDLPYYRTGDLVRYAPDGSIIYLGRKDLQAKVNGQRLELLEVEWQICRYNGFSKCVVDVISPDLLVAFIMVDPPREGPYEQPLPPETLPQDIVNDLRTFLRSVLPRFMVPVIYVPVDSWPTKVSGKVDRPRLRASVESRIDLYRCTFSEMKRRPQTSTQNLLTVVWAQILSLDSKQIGLDSDFVSLGGQSLAAIKLATTCREIGFHLDIADIFRNPRLEDMAKHVNRGRFTTLPTTRFIENSKAKSNSNLWGPKEVSRIAEACGLDEEEIEDIYPCTPIQEACIAVTARVPQAYILRQLFSLPLNIDLARFRAAWDLVHENNPILRTRLCSIATIRGVENVQVVCRCPCDWVESSFGGSPDAADMGLGTSLVRYRISISPDGILFELLKHHSIYDGFSEKLFWDDFRYAFTHLARPQYRPPYRQYIDYLCTLGKEKTVEFWKNYLKGFQGERFPILPSPEYVPKAMSQMCKTVEKKAQWNKSSQFTFATFARAAWAVILSTRDCTPGSTKDICFAAVLSGRTAPLEGLEDMMGPTITTVPVRVKLDFDQPIDEYLRQVQEQAIAMIAFEYLGLSEIRWVSDEAHNACKATNLLVVQPPQLEKNVFPSELTRVTTDRDGIIEVFGLVIECSQSHMQDSISLSASYDPALMAEREVHHLLQQLFRMITELNYRCTDGSVVRSAIWSLADENEFQRMVEWNRTSQLSPLACLHELVEKSASCHPDRIAIDANDRRLRYGELDAAADAFAATLQDNYKVKPGDLVPLCFEKSSSMIVAILGILKAGAGYVPLDINYPSSRVKYIIREIKARLVVVSPLQAKSSKFLVPILVLNPQPISTPLTRVKRHSATPQDVAYVLFTSGTSGPPKGVVIEHGASSLSCLEHGKRYQFSCRGSSLRTLQFNSYTFDPSVLDIFATLAYGGCLCIPSEQERMGNLEDFLTRMEINFAFLTPTVANLLEPSKTPTLRLLSLGGEMANRSLIRKWTSDESPLEAFFNSYGPTEASISCALGKVSSTSLVGHVGKRLGGSLWIVDEADHNHLAPVSCMGEMAISGPTLARGYLNGSELDKAAFIEHIPWLAKIGERRLYKTGDIARFDLDGNVEILGRKEDGQIKLNGRRIELGEIENAIGACQCISTAQNVAAAKVNISGNPTLAAFILLPGENKNVVEGLHGSIFSRPLKQHRAIINNVEDILREKLPEYLIPRLWLPVSSWPFTTSGKTDRKRLVAACEALSSATIMNYQRSCNNLAEYGEPVSKSKTEEVIGNAWKHVLRKENGIIIEPEDDFFKLGGDSLRAIMLISALRDKNLHITAQEIFMTKSLRGMAQLIDSKTHVDKKIVSQQPQSLATESGPVEIEFADIPQNPQLEDVVKHVDKRRPTTLATARLIGKSNMKSNDNSLDSLWGPEEVSRIAEACGLDDKEIEDIYPCTPIQEACIAVTARVPQAYVLRQCFRIKMNVDLARFRAAWDLVHENNPILRTRICSTATICGVQNVQVVCRRRCDWVETSPVGSPHAADMGLGTSLVRYRISMSPDGNLFELLKHHSILDGFSEKLFWDDFRYALKHLARPQSRPPYRQYVDYLFTLGREKTVEFWKNYLKGFQGEHFPILPSPDYSFKATSRTCERIKEKAQWKESSQFTFETVARAAWAVILSTRSRAPGPAKDICFAAVLSGRTAPVDGLEDMMGPTITTVPVRVKLDLDQPIDEYLGQIQEQATAMAPFEYFGLSEIRWVSNEAHNACKSANLLVLQPLQVQEDVLPLELTRMTANRDGIIEEFGLVIECTQGHMQDSISLSASYDSSLMAKREVRHLLQQLLRMIIELNNRCSDSSAIRSAIWSLSNENDFQAMLKWNRASAPPPSTCLHELVEESARRHPERLAIVANNERLRYGEIDAAADALAATLQEDYDIRAGDLVPLCFEKSSSMVVAILGILKAGAGYVPLDINHPISRLEYMIREIRARLVVVSPLQAKSFSFLVPALVLSPKLPITSSVHFKRHLATPQDVAYVIFTSGSSGPPKGVICEHGPSSLSVLEHGMRFQHNRRGGSLRTLQFNSYTFDPSVLDIFATMAFGGCLCIPSEQDRMENLEDFITRMEVNFADLTPTVANLLEPSNTPTLRSLSIGGEMANRAVITKWTSSETPLENFFNTYGPTEAGIGCAVGDITPKSLVGHVGKRVGGSLWIVDEANHNHLVPISCLGELVVSGPTLARGYLNDSERTKVSFIEHVPWLARIGEKRMYKTGDLARIDVDGNVEILGRKEDGQIKLHGRRLELGEIETAIGACQCLSTAQYIAVAKVNMGGNPILAAFILLPGKNNNAVKALPGSILSRPSKQQRVIMNKVEDSLRGKLPEYMIPRLWMPVSFWPFTASGKTDRKCLAAVFEALSPSVIKDYQRSRDNLAEEEEPISMTNTERVIEDIAQLIDSQPHVDESSGSVLTSSSPAKNHDEQSRPISARSSYKKLSAGDDISADSNSGSDSANKRSVETEQLSAFSRDEKRLRSLWASVLHRPEHLFVRKDNFFSCGGDAVAVLHLSRIANVVKIRLSVADIHAHPTLSQMAKFIRGDPNCRTASTAEDTFASLGNYIDDVIPASHTQLAFLIEGQKWCQSYYAWVFIEIEYSAPVAKIQEVCQVVAERHPILQTSFHLVGRQCYQAIRRSACDFKVLFYNGVPDQMCARLDKDVEHPVRFERVLTRFRLLIHTESGRQMLALGLSHAQYDGFCLPTILNDLRLAYLGKLPNSRTSPSYRRFIECTLQSPNEDTNAFWRETLKGSSITSIVRATGNPRPVMNSGMLRSVPFKFKHSGDISYAVMLKAAWALVLSRLSQSSDVTFWSLVSGRFAAFEGAQDVVGPCLNLIPARVRIDANQSFRCLLQQIYEQQVAAIPYESATFDPSTRRTLWPASMRHASIFQYQNLPDQEASEKESSNLSGWTTAGFAVYGGGLLQNGGCWLVAGPEEHGCAGFCFRFCEETMSPSTAESTFDLFSKTLHAINDNLDDKVCSTLSFPIGEGLLGREGHPPSTPEVIGSHQALSQSIPPACRTVIDSLVVIWVRVLHPSPEKTDQYPTIGQDESFFDLGGDSISAAELASLYMEAGFDLTLQDIIDFPTLRLQTLLISGLIDRAARDPPKLHYVPGQKFIF